MAHRRNLFEVEREAAAVRWVASPSFVKKHFGGQATEG